MVNFNLEEEEGSEEGRGAKQESAPVSAVWQEVFQRKETDCA